MHPQDSLHLAEAQAISDHLPEARTLALQALQTLERARRPREAARAEILLGDLATATGSASARYHFERAIHLAEGARDDALACEAGCELAMVTAAEAAFDAALAHLWTAAARIPPGQDRGHRMGRVVEYARGVVHLLQGARDLSQESLAETAAQTQEDMDPAFEARIYTTWAEALLDDAQLDAAGQWLDRAASLVRTASDTAADRVAPSTAPPGPRRSYLPCLRLRIPVLQALRHRLLGEHEAAMTLLEEATGRAVRYGNPGEQTRLQVTMATVALQLGEFGRAEALLDQATTRASDLLVRIPARLVRATLALSRFDARPSHPAGLLQAAADEAQAARQDLDDNFRVVRDEATRHEAEGVDRPVQRLRQELAALDASIAWRRSGHGEPVDWPGCAQALRSAAEALEIRGHLPEAVLAREDLLHLCVGWSDATGLDARAESALLTEVDHLLTLFETLGAPARAAHLEDWLRTRHPARFGRVVLGRYVPVEICARAREVQTRPMAVLVADVRGFSEMGRSVSDPAEIFARMSEMFRVLNRAVYANAGAVLRYFGDGFLAVFDDNDGQACAHALSCALDVRDAFRSWNLRRRECALPPVEVGLGIHYGPLAVGRVIARGRWEYTAHGDTINTAAHLEQATRRLGVHVLASEVVIQRAPGVPCRTLLHPALELKHGVRLAARSVLQIANFRAVFAGFGETVPPTPGTVALDVGGAACPGVVDHHQDDPTVAGESATALLARHPEWVLDHLPGDRTTRWTPPPVFILHRDPDLDCCAAAWLAQALLEATPDGVPALLARVQRLVAYVTDVDQGRRVLPPDPSASPHLLFSTLAHEASAEARRLQRSDVARNRLILTRGMFLVDVLLHRLDAEPDLPVESAFAGDPGPFARQSRAIDEDWRRYRDDLARARTFRVFLPTGTGGERVERSLVRIEAPTCRDFKVWARSEGWDAQHVIYPPREDPRVAGTNVALRRHVLSVPPESDLRLEDLGAALQVAETARRTAIREVSGIDLLPRGQDRPGYDSPDPWYDGRGHARTIVDAPNSGSVLTVDEVHDVLVQLYDAREEGSALVPPPAQPT